MVIKQLDKEQYESLTQALLKKANTEPLDASYTVTIRVNREEYALKVQPDWNNRVAALQALRVDREEDGPNFDLITESSVLSALLELLIYQGVA